MAIKLPGGVYTREPAVDHRLKRILQVVQRHRRQAARRSAGFWTWPASRGTTPSSSRAHGSEVVGIEGRAASVAKCNFARDAMGFERASFHQDDVRNLSVAKYGMFDIVICSGLLYHLPAHDAWA